MNTNITIGGLFLEGILSFFTPCVLPLIPLYIGYMTAGRDPKEKNHRLKVFVLTLCFVLGICTVFFIAGLGSQALKTIAGRYSLQFQLFGGVLLLLFGMNVLGVIQIPFLQQEHRPSLFKLGKSSCLQAYLLGFFFSFAWSPCIGPMLASAMISSASAGSPLYLIAYAAGFILPFLVLGLFTDQMLVWLKDHRSVVKYTGILGGIVVSCMGLYMLYLGNRQILQLQKVHTEAGGSAAAEAAVNEEASGPQNSPSVSSGSGTAAAVPNPAGKNDAEKYNFSLYDSQGTLHHLTDYVGKPLVMNFFGTWCYYCNMELPHLEELSHGDQAEVILIATPNLGGETDEEGIKKYMEEHGYTMTVLYDRDYSVTQTYGISGYPTTFIMKPDGNYLGYVPGYVDEKTLDQAIEEALAPEKTEAKQ